MIVLNPRDVPEAIPWLALVRAALGNYPRAVWLCGVFEKNVEPGRGPAGRALVFSVGRVGQILDPSTREGNLENLGLFRLSWGEWATELNDLGHIWLVEGNRFDPGSLVGRRTWLEGI